MNAIIGMSEILTRSNLSPRDMECVNDISESAHSLLSIINDILDMSKIESGKMSLNPVHYDFPSMMDNVVSMFTYVAKKNGLAFRFEAEGELPKYLYGDDVRLRQMLINLCGNAVKFTEEGFVRLKYSSDGSNMVFEIQDTGVGIAKEDIPTIFNDYEQSSTSKNRYISGSGLGLAICKRFAEMMGGNIELQSEYGKGSCFTITIPIVMGDPSEISVKDHWHEEKTIRVDNANILIVDDNEYNLKVAHGLLSLYGIDADMADSGRKAIAKVSEKEYDIVFMDHMMPDMDGIETTAEIRKQGGKYMDVAIIALTANAIKGAKEMFLANGFNEFISKPIEMPVLTEALIKWLPETKVREITQEAKATDDSGAYDDFIQTMSGIDEIDTETGLRRVNGLTDMYIGNLKLFHRKLAADGEKMSAYLSDGDIKAFSIIVHAMKSVLAGVGAAGLSDTAYRLETASKDDDAEYCNEHFPDFIENLLALHSKLSLIFPMEESGKEEKEKGDAAYLTENVQKAIEAINDFNVDSSIDMVSKLTAYDFGGDVNTMLTAALTALKQYNYDEAKNCLTGLLSSAGV
jgi:CheY-like chemotaxis protein/HPt (histidine-containing phosphotransfer) domain-containing protein/anti-sigma regulatory factor (Ser/Thr protein kinase)